MLENFLDIIFPPKCGFCKKIEKEFLCKKCELKIEHLKKDKIIRSSNEYFKYQMYGYLYEDIIRKKILEFKFSDKPELSDTFVKLLLINEKICRFLESYDIIIPVPMYKKKQILRGYNQTELIAKKLAKKLNLEYENALIKQRNTQMQSQLDALDRKSNVKDAYAVINQEKIKKKKAILFDDVYTTGSTASECAKMLIKAGAKGVAVLTIAKD